MVLNLILFPVIILFIANAFCHLYYAIKLNKKYPTEHNIHNSFLTCILWIVAGLLYPLFFRSESNIQLFQYISVFFICVLSPIIIFLILSYQYYFVVKKNPDIKGKRNIDSFLREFNNKNIEENKEQTYSLKTDIYRKTLHLFPAIIIIFLWIFSIYVWEGTWNADLIWNISGEQFGKFLIITSGYSGILIFAALDYVRLSYIFKKKKIFHFLPDRILHLLQKSLKKNEIFEFTKPAVLILAFTPIFLLPFGIFAAGSLIGTMGDGAASIIGLKFGKYKFPRNSNKTIIGYIAGFIASFIISFLCLVIFMNCNNLFKIILIAIGGALTFFAIDLSNVIIDDNILNPLFCGLIMGLLYCML